jgi:hypothetical protein
MRKETDPIPETLCFILLKLPSDGQSPETQLSREKHFMLLRLKVSKNVGQSYYSHIATYSCSYLLQKDLLFKKCVVEYSADRGLFARSTRAVTRVEHPYRYTVTDVNGRVWMNILLGSHT